MTIDKASSWKEASHLVEELLEETMRSCVRNGLGSILGSQFLQDGGDVFLHRSEGENKGVGNLLIGCPSYQEAQHALFLGSQRLQQGGMVLLVDLYINTCRSKGLQQVAQGRGKRLLASVSD